LKASTSNVASKYLWPNVIPREGVERFCEFIEFGFLLLTPVIPREGVESRLRLFPSPLSFPVIPREGVESRRLQKDLEQELDYL
jgi:hypothetical protein